MSLSVPGKSMLMLAICILLLNNLAYGRTIKGVNIPEQATIAGNPQVLILNGAGIRSKFIISVYIGALYLPKKQTDAEQIFKSNSPRMVTMHCLYHEISKEKLVDAWNEGFSDNSDKQTLAHLQERILQFNKLFPALHEGDIIKLVYLPGKGTQLIFNDETLGLIPGEDFNIALLKVWLGEEPADYSLKEAMLSQDE